MNADLLRRGRIVLAVLWVILAACFLVDPEASSWVAAGRTLFAVLVIAHAAEFLYFRRTLQRVGGSMAHHLVQVLLFGVVHVQLARFEAGEIPAGPGSRA